MTLLWIIYIACVFVWLLPPFRQYKTPYFSYFLCLALGDPATIFMRSVLGLPLWQGHVITSLIDIIILLNRKEFKGYSIIIALLIPLMFMFPLINNNTLHNVVAFNLLIVTVIIAKDFFEDIKLSECINTYYLVLLLYNITGVMKILFRVKFASTGHLYFFTANLFQIFLAVYFTMYSVKNAKRVMLARVLPEKN